MAVTDNLALPVMEAGQAQKHVTFNEAMALLDGLGGEWTEDLDLSSALATTLTLPAPGLVFGASWRVLEEVTFSGGGASWGLGDDGDGDTVAANATRYGDGLAPAAGTTGAGPVSSFALYDAATPLRVAPDAGAITGGVVRLRAFWRALTIPAA